MEHRHDHQRKLSAGGRDLAPYAVAEPMPRAGILAAWFNAGATLIPRCPLLTGDNPFNGTAVDLPTWTAPRMELTTSLGDLVELATGPARVALPVPGDPGGLPAGVPAAAAAGQALLITTLEGSVVVFPTVLRGPASAVWQALPAGPLPPYSSDLRSARLSIMELLTEAVSLLESLPAPAPQRTDLAATLRQLEHLPMPPGSTPAALELAASSARLLAIVAAAASSVDDTTTAGRAVLAAVVPLGRAGRAALSVALSAPPAR